VLTIVPKFAEAHVGRALTLCALGRLDEALASADRAAELKPSLAAAHVARADALDALGRKDEARSAREQAAAAQGPAPNGE
jgi:Flp pilus assembly protein TadD